MNRYWCLLCGWIYQEREGEPDQGIDPGTKWDDVPDTYTCPACGAMKADFAMMG